MQKLKEPKKTAHGEETHATQGQIELDAYFHWIERGSPLDDPLTDWVEAEKKWKASLVEEEEED